MANILKTLDEMNDLNRGYTGSGQPIRHSFIAYSTLILPKRHNRVETKDITFVLHACNDYPAAHGMPWRVELQSCNTRCVRKQEMVTALDGFEKPKGE